jgi:hypothetical protein
VLPVDPDTVKVHGGQESGQGNGTQASVVTQQRRNLLLVSISNSVTGSVRLEERRGGIGCHALGSG